MTEKRYTISDKQFISYYGGEGHQISDGECKFWLWHNKEESQKVCDKLNNLIDENEQLKSQREDLKRALAEKDKEIMKLRRENNQMKRILND